MDMKNNASMDSLMREAVRLAVSGSRRVSPNPRTGALVLREGTVIGKGRHEYAGGPHAEVNAIRDAGADVTGCDLVVTLEPCCHTGKTPPCTDLIIRSGIRRVIVGMTDPNPLVAGNGIRQLRRAGIEVVENVLTDECAEINQPFIKMMTKKFPYVIAKSAVTLDGLIADENGQSKWISSETSRRTVHVMRAAADAVLIGIGTALADDPELTVRDAEGDHPLRVVYDPEGMMRPDMKLVATAKEIPTCIIAGPHSTPLWKSRMEQKGVNVIITGLFGSAGLEDGLRRLGEQGVQSILAEGGGRLHSMLAELDHIDRMEWFIAPKLVGKGVRMMQIPARQMEEAMTFVESFWRQSGPDAHFKGIIKKYQPENGHDRPEKE